MKNMKMMTAAEMEKISGGDGLYNTPAEIRRELPGRGIGLPDESWLERARRRWPEAPDMIDPELLRKLKEQILELDTMQ